MPQKVEVGRRDAFWTLKDAHVTTQRKDRHRHRSLARHRRSPRPAPRGGRLPSSSTSPGSAPKRMHRSRRLLTLEITELEETEIAEGTGGNAEKRRNGGNGTITVRVRIACCSRVRFGTSVAIAVAAVLLPGQRTPGERGLASRRPRARVKSGCAKRHPLKCFRDIPFLRFLFRVTARSLRPLRLLRLRVFAVLVSRPRIAHPARNLMADGALSRRELLRRGGEAGALIALPVAMHGTAEAARLHRPPTPRPRRTSISRLACGR